SVPAGARAGRAPDGRGRAGDLARRRRALLAPRLEHLRRGRPPARAAAVTAMLLLVILGMGLSGVLLWRALAPALRPLAAGSTTGAGVVYALVGVVGA